MCVYVCVCVCTCDLDRFCSDAELWKNWVMRVCVCVCVCVCACVFLDGFVNACMHVLVPGACLRTTSFVRNRGGERKEHNPVG